MVQNISLVLCKREARTFLNGSRINVFTSLLKKPSPGVEAKRPVFFFLKVRDPVTI